MLLPPERQRLFDIARLAAERAGAFIRSRWDEPRQIELKDDESLVTEIDRGAEAIIREVLLRHAPQSAILGEEEGVSGAQDDNEDQVWWYVDPLDGTTNLAHGFPWVAVSIALIVHGQAEAAVVFNPILGHEFAALRDGGATLNGQPIQVSETDTIHDALLSTGFPVGQKNPLRFRNFDYARHIMGHCHALRRAGSAALDCAAVSAGWLDGFWELGLHAWDTPAGWLLVEEAGGQVTRLDGGAFDPHFPEIIATNGRIHDPLVALLSEARAKLST